MLSFASDPEILDRFFVFSRVCSMKNLLIVLSLVGLFGHSSATNAFGQAKIDGEWSVTRATVAGKFVPKNVSDSMLLKITGNKFEAKSGESSSQGMISVIESARGKTKAVFKIENGDDVGREINAIFQMAAGSLQIAFSQDSEFPASFRSTADNKFVYMVYVDKKAQAAASQRGRKADEPEGLPHFQLGGG